MVKIRTLAGLSFVVLIYVVDSVIETECRDEDFNCRDYVGEDMSKCAVPGYIRTSCPRTCRICIANIPREYDTTFLPADLKPLSFLVGIWRTESEGKVQFPTIPRFTFGEQIEFKIPGVGFGALAALNYSTFAWSMNGNTIINEELHSETGYLALRAGTSRFALTTVMSNGFVTVEEGELRGQRELEFRLVDIGRISFSRDLPVHDLRRTWRLLTPTTLEARILMETLTNHLSEHTLVVYHKIFP